MSTTFKSWATPLAIGTFTIAAVSGLLIFFDIEIGLIKPVHKWLSWLFISSVILHTTLHWKQFTGYFSKKSALCIIGSALIITIGSVLPIFGEHEENPGKIAAHALASSSLETVALVIKTKPERLVEQLGKSGILVKDPSLTIQQIARSNRKSEREILGTILIQAKGSGIINGDND